MNVKNLVLAFIFVSFAITVYFFARISIDGYWIWNKAPLQNIISRINKKIDLYHLVTIDIAFCVIFYGVGEEGQIVLRKKFLYKYNHPFYHKLIRYLAMKPRQQDTTAFERWEEFKALDLDRRNQIFEELYKKRRALLTETYSDDAIYYKNTGIGIKYYGGHQHRLGHYFRHLFQTYRFLNDHKDIPDKEKYFYGKILRAQLSTYEQALLFVDSISSLGFKWELTPKYETSPNLSAQEKLLLRKDHQLISKYNLIKNLPGDRFLDVVYSHYYPNVKFESEEIELMVD